MALIVTYDNPAAVDGAYLEVGGLGVLRNREPLTLTEDQERAFASYHRRTVTEALTDDDNYELSGTALLTGSLKEVTGIDLDSISDTPAAGVPTGDLSPATSMGETESTPAPVEVVKEEVTPPPRQETSFTSLTETKVLEGGDS